MMNSNNVKTIVLLGAGHTHALALAQISKVARLENIHVILISGESYMPYSGMLPGVIAGLYEQAEFLLDVEKLAQENHITYIPENATKLDLRLRQVQLASGIKVSYDYLSINIGGDCKDVIQEEGGNVMPVKPVVPFIHWLENWKNMKDATVAVVGSGIAGVEVALSLDARLRELGRIGGVYLIGRNKEIVPDMPNLAKVLRKVLIKRGISQVLGQAAKSALPGYIKLANGAEHRADYVVVCTGVNTWHGLAESGLAVDERGCAIINQWLQSVSHQEVFVCGDCASWFKWEIPKSGVFAVRQAEILAQNINAICHGDKLIAWNTSTKYLSIVCLGDETAIAHRDNRVLSGKLVWRWKDYLDQKFMSKFS